MKTTFLGLIAASIITSGVNAAPINLLTNGSFEDFSGGTTTNGTTYGSGLVITGWTSNRVTGTNPGDGVAIQATPGTTRFNGTVSQDNASSLSPDAAGSHAAYFVDDNANETLSQSVTLTGGTLYSIGFDYYQVETGNPNPFTLTATFGTQAVTTATSLSAQPTNTWFNATQTFVAPTSGTYNFTFAFTSGAAPADDALVDRVFVTAVPEPVSMALLGSGLIGTAMLRRRLIR